VVALATSPTITTSLITGSSSFDLLNTNSTTINFAGAVTTFAIGNTATAAQTVNMFTTSTGASTYNFATGVTGAVTKTVNFVTGGGLTSTTNINIGSSVNGAKNNIYLGSNSLGRGNTGGIILSAKRLFIDGGGSATFSSTNITSTGSGGSDVSGTLGTIINTTTATNGTMTCTFETAFTSAPMVFISPLVFANSATYTITSITNTAFTVAWTVSSSGGSIACYYFVLTRDAL
jgi:hypothetical protein